MLTRRIFLQGCSAVMGTDLVSETAPGAPRGRAPRLHIGIQTYIFGVGGKIINHV